MKYPIALLLCCLLLCGCAGEVLEETTVPITEITAIPTTSAEGLYDMENPLEEQYHGHVRVYPLNRSDVFGMLILGGQVLILSGEETTTLTLLRGENLYLDSEKQLDFFLDGEDPSLAVRGGTLSFFDPMIRKTVVLDKALHPVSQIAAPEGLVGVPLLSGDRNTLYYCTETALRAWDLESGIRRTLKEMAYPGQTVAGLHWGDTIVHCQAEGTNYFLSSADGRLVAQWDGEMSLLSTDSTFSASITLGQNPLLVYESAQSPKMLLPEDFSRNYFLLNGTLAAVAYLINPDETVQLEYYDLTSGTRSSQIALPAGNDPISACMDEKGFVYILAYDAGCGCNIIYRWDVAALPSGDGQSYEADYATKTNPLPSDLVLCQRYAAELSAKHGIQILIGKEAAATDPWDYKLEAETQPSLILQELMLLDARLSRYPEGFLATTASNFSALKLCLVRSVTSSAESGSLQAATGVQFLERSEAYVAIAVGRYAEQALYHELFHAMETHIFNNSIAFDQWDSLNPSGFSYDYGYVSNEVRDAGVYLEQEERSFIDRYSMSFPREDRARIMEYAMLEGNQQLFKAPALQAKLQAICDGIREAYDLENSEDTFPWEQYLK